MEFVEGLGDLSGVPRFFVTRVGAAGITSGCIVTVVLCTDQFGDDRPTLSVPALILDWPLPNWVEARDALKIVRDQIDKMPLILPCRPRARAH